MTNLTDHLNDLTLEAIEAREKAYSTIKDPDEAEQYLEELLLDIVIDYKFKIKESLEKVLQ